MIQAPISEPSSSRGTRPIPFRTSGLSQYNSSHKNMPHYAPLSSTSSSLGEASQPTLPPPSAQYTRQQRGCLEHSYASPSAGAAYAAKSVHIDAARRGPRLFDPSPEDPIDPASFFGTLGHELRGLRDEDAIALRHARLLRTGRQVMILAAIQTGAALVMLLTQLMRLAGHRDAAAILTSLIVATSGGLGMYGALRHTIWPLHAFFLTQIWVLAAVTAQWMRSETTAARLQIYYTDRSKSTPPTDVFHGLAIFVALGVVYGSMYYTDLLAERIQDELEQADERSLLHFAWLMHKKTLVGVQRFEDMIHAKFEELVLLGFLKPRWHPQGRAAQS